MGFQDRATRYSAATAASRWAACARRPASVRWTSRPAAMTATMRGRIGIASSTGMRSPRWPSATIPRPDRPAARAGTPRGLVVGRKLGDRDGLGGKGLSDRRTVIVVRQHPHAGFARDPGQPRDRSGDIIGAGDDAVHETIECLAGKPGAFDHAIAL